MIHMRKLLGLILGLGILATSLAHADDADVKKKKGGPGVTGIVTSIDPEKEKPEQGSITIKTMAKKDAGAERKFMFDATTTFERAAKKKPDKIQASDVAKDHRVMIQSKDGKKADLIRILPAAKKE
jgi:hypothetical protein